MSIQEAASAAVVAAARCICPNNYSWRYGCPVHEPDNAGCTCQYGVTTPKWYITVKTCPIHAATYDPMQAPAWAATKCGPEGVEVWRDREHLLLTSVTAADAASREVQS